MIQKQKLHSYKKPLLAVLFMVVFMLSAYCAEADAIADSKVNTAVPMYISGDNLVYDNEHGNITGSGHVMIKQDETTVFADKMYINTETGDVSAEGNVLMIRGELKIQSDELYYNTKTKSAYTEDVHVTKAPFIIRGKKMKREGKTNEIDEPLFTTCNMQKPHYRMQSSVIFIYDEDKLEAWNTVVYLGAVPVMYLPYYSQPLKTRKTPFDFKAGHNESTGWYAYIKYNYFFDEINSGAVGFDYMEKLGNKYSLDLNYGFSRNSTGTFNGFYNILKNEGLKGKDRWSIRHAHTHRFDERTSFGTNVETFSDRNLNKDFFENGVDTFSQKGYAYFSSSAGNHSFSISVADTEVLNTITAKYYTQGRVLPQFTYSMTSTQILPRFYYAHSMNLTRSYIIDGNYYDNRGGITPSLTYSLPSLLFATLTGSAGLTSAWTHSEKNKGLGELLNNGNISETLVLNIVPGLFTVNASHAMSKQLNKNSGMKYTGITSNMISSSLYASLGIARLSASTTYDLKPDKSELINDKERFSPLSASVSGSLNNLYINTSANYSIFGQMIKNTSAGIGFSEPEKSKWNVSASMSYVNNLIDGYGHPVLNMPDSLTFNSLVSFSFTDEFKLTVTRGYDMMKKQTTSETYALNWFLHCWQANLSYSKRLKDETSYSNDFYFSIFVSDLPELKLNKPNSSAPNENLLFGQLLQQ